MSKSSKYIKAGTAALGMLVLADNANANPRAAAISSACPTSMSLTQNEMWVSSITANNSDPTNPSTPILATASFTNDDDSGFSFGIISDAHAQISGGITAKGTTEITPIVTRSGLIYIDTGDLCSNGQAVNIKITWNSILGGSVEGKGTITFNGITHNVVVTMPAGVVTTCHRAYGPAWTKKAETIMAANIKAGTFCPKTK